MPAFSKLARSIKSFFELKDGYSFLRVVIFDGTASSFGFVYMFYEICQILQSGAISILNCCVEAAIAIVNSALCNFKINGNLFDEN